MIFHVYGNQSSDRFLPGWNPTVLANEIAGIIIFLIAVIVDCPRFCRRFTIVSSRTISSSATASATRTFFLIAKIGNCFIIRFGRLAVLHEVEIIV